jgi:DNA replication licensing factor MCM4
MGGDEDGGLGPLAPESQPRGTPLLPTQDDLMMSPPMSAGDHLLRAQAQRQELAQETYIWGTQVNVGDTQLRFKRFLENFELPDSFGASFYDERMREMEEKGETNLDLDCQHLHAYDSYLYKLLIKYPQEIIPLFDIMANEYFAENVAPPNEEEANLTRIIVRPFNAMETKPMRDLNPSDIDKMVSVRGMVTRCTSIIPDLKLAYFKCLMCGFAPDHVQVDRGRVQEPALKCAQCGKPGTMTLIHNQCVFANKQTVKMQETPDAIPEGETPHTVSMCVFDDLVDQAKPGDRVEVTGVYRAVPIRMSSTRRTLKSVYKTYLDIIHIRKDVGARLRNTAGPEDDEAAKNSAAERASTTTASNQSPQEQVEFTPARLAEIQALGRAPDVYERLVASLAPSIWELEDVKKGLLCQLFGATNKTFSGTAANKVRGDINVLLVGDPGVAKSQLLTYVHRIAPRGMYTSGRGSSAVGLTAYVTRDPESKDMVLESGALVLSDRGICCIDEFDKMSDSARSMLHEVMEQQTVSIAKAGIIAVLNARTSVLASANPVGSRYNPNMSMVENIQLPPTLLSRFDLLYLLLDRPNPETDRRLARHLVSLHYKDPPKKKRGAIPAELLTDYVSYARANVQPQVSDEAAEELVEGYVEMRRMGGSRKVITATPRQLESLIRLSESLARMRLSEAVDRDDAKEALRLMRVAMQQSAVDPRTGTIDMDKILTGHSASDRQHRKTVAEGITACLATSSGKLRLNELVRMLAERDSSMTLSVQEVRDAAMLLVEQETCSIRGDLVTLLA